MASPVQRNSEVKVEELCRTCLSKEIELYSVFDIYLREVTLNFVIATVTGIKIEEGDGLPSTICQDCREKAVNAFSFKEKSHESDTILRNHITKQKKTDSKQITPVETLSAEVKCEHLVTYDGDDYVDSDFASLVNPAEDFKEYESVKKENFSQVEYLPCNVTPDKVSLKRKCIKVEFEDAVDAFCPLCDTNYDDADNLTKHMWNKHADLMGPKKRGRPKKLITSSILTKLYESGFYLKSGPAKVHKCLICDELCKSKEDLSIHMLCHKDTKLFCCILCKKMYLKKSDYEGHGCIDNRRNIFKVQDPAATLQSDNKQISFPTEMLLHDILCTHSELEKIEPLQVCSKCNSVFFSEIDLINHNDAEHPELSLRCNLCTKVFASVKSAARHRSICKQIERNYVCSTCGLKFAYEISLNKHILRYHEGQSVSVRFMDTKTKMEERKYQCDTCKRCFYRKELLVRHTKIHMPNEKYYECDVCKKKFHRSDNLRSHKRVHDLNQGKSTANTGLCLYCGRSFSNSSNLIVHMRRHTGEKPYKCDFCGKGFPRSSDLQCHRRSHTGEKPCVCRVCGKGFSRSNKLSRHMRVHTGHKPYKCTYCEKAFSQSNDLTLHIRRHTGDKPYICEVCGDRFIQGSALQNHRRAQGHFPPSSSDSQTPAVTYNNSHVNH